MAKQKASLRTAPVEVRFCRHLAPAKNGCVLWTGTKLASGYGVICRSDKRANGMVKAHRLAWEIANGPIPAGALVLHRCDTKLCVNVGHLFLGTHADNVADKVAKSRQAKGRKHGRSKLTEAGVISIRARYAAGGVRLTDLAREYGVSIPSIAAVIHHATWQHVATPGQ